MKKLIESEIGDTVEVIVDGKIEERKVKEVSVSQIGDRKCVCVLVDKENL